VETNEARPPVPVRTGGKNGLDDSITYCLDHGLIRLKDYTGVKHGLNIDTVHEICEITPR
jgi:hypothetical protein